MRLRLPRVVLALAVVGGGLLAAGGPAAVARDATDGWYALQDRVEGPVPATVALPPGPAAAQGRLRPGADTVMRAASRRVDEVCGTIGGIPEGPARIAALRQLDLPMAELATLYRRAPGVAASTGPLRLVLLHAADAIALGCRDGDRAEMLRRAVVRGDRRT